MSLSDESSNNSFLFEAVTAKVFPSGENAREEIIVSSVLKSSSVGRFEPGKIANNLEPDVPATIVLPSGE